MQHYTYLSHVGTGRQPAVEYRHRDAVLLTPPLGAELKRLFRHHVQPGDADFGWHLTDRLVESRREICEPSMDEIWHSLNTSRVFHREQTVTANQEYG